MVAVIDHCSGLPAVIFYSSHLGIHTDDIDGLIVAHRNDDGNLFGQDFVCQDQYEAIDRLKALAEASYPGIEIIDRLGAN